MTVQRAGDAPGERLRLPFTVIDESVHLLDTAAEPWTIQCELGLEGRLDGDRLDRAVTAGLDRHPMARVRQLPARHRDRTWSWEVPAGADVEPLSTVEWDDEDTLNKARAEFYSLPVPLVESPPLRLRLARGLRRDVLMLSANHAAFDGFGCLRLLHSVARAYRGVDDPPPPVDLSEARDVVRLLDAGDPNTRRNRSRALADKATDLLSRPTPLAPDGGRDLPGFGFHQVALSEVATATLGDGKATVNDLLVAALHLAIDAWNAERHVRSGRIGVLVPMNFRPKEWRQDVVTNFVLNARVATSAAERRDPAGALEAVTKESERLKEGGGAALVEVLGGAGSLPLWAKEPLSPLLWLTGNRLVDSAILSNLGQVSEPPSFGSDGGETTELWFSAPCRMPCAVSIGAATVEKRLHLAFRYRHAALGAAAARRFADCYLGELERVVAV
ncbi:MAG TPA: hypothetical protein VG455_11025 [Acidimicrobiales bacterium]|nr:hypothetical protein [Acidimicrobiales bacterium]